MMRHLLLALLCVLALVRPVGAQLSVNETDNWFDSIQNISVAGAFGTILTNETGTGTQNTYLACLTTSGTAVTCAAGGSGSEEVLGPVTFGGGATGLVSVATGGVALCTFGGATTAGHYVQLSGTENGKCTDTGAASWPNTGVLRVIGTVMSTNASAGIYPVYMFPRGTMGVLPTAVPDTAVVAGDVTHAQSDTTLSDVTGLVRAIGVSSTEIWRCELLLLLSAASGTPDYKFGFSYPTAATIKWGYVTVTGSSNASVGQFGGFSTLGTTVALATETETVSVGSGSAISGQTLIAVIFGGGTAGNVQFRFAQNTSNASDIKVLKGSSMRCAKIAI